MRRWRTLLALSFLLGIALVGQAAEGSVAQLTFLKTFKGRDPERVRVVVREDGQASYQGGSEIDPGKPDDFRLSAALTARLFSLAASLNYFRGLELELQKPVADLGWKTFVYEKGDARAEVSYNYTRNKTAEELQRLFEGIAQGRHLLAQLESRLVFDRLGIVDVLREFERAFNAGELVDLEQFVPVLERIASDRRLMRLAQTRAYALLRRIGGTSGRLQFEYGNQRINSYTRVVVEEGGASSYEARRFDQPSQEQPLALPEGVAARLTELVRLANYFRGYTTAAGTPQQLSGYRLTYEAGTEHNELAFAVPPDAVVAEIVRLFQRVLQQEDFRQRLRAAVDEGSVTLQVVLQELEAAVGSEGVADPKGFVPILEEIVRGPDVHPLVREQAERLLARIRATP